jgi:hypothetical protein
MPPMSVPPVGFAAALEKSDDHVDKECKTEKIPAAFVRSYQEDYG